MAALDELTYASTAFYSREVPEPLKRKLVRIFC
jgi:hypothetical protein